MYITLILILIAISIIMYIIFKVKTKPKKSVIDNIIHDCIYNKNMTIAETVDAVNNYRKNLKFEKLKQERKEKLNKLNDL